MVMVFTLGLGRSKGDKFDSMGDKPHLLLIQSYIALMGTLWHEHYTIQADHFQRGTVKLVHFWIL